MLAGHASMNLGVALMMTGAYSDAQTAVDMAASLRAAALGSEVQCWCPVCGRVLVQRRFCHRWCWCWCCHVCAALVCITLLFVVVRLTSLFVTAAAVGRGGGVAVVCITLLFVVVVSRWCASPCS